MLDRQLIRYFLGVVDAGQFSRAARLLNVTQPTLSYGIRQLEDQLGHRVFVRSRAGVTLTPWGSRFLPHAREIEAEFNRALESVSGLAPKRPVRLGVLATIDPTQIAELGTRLLAVVGPEDLELVEGSAREIAADLRRGRVDMAVTLQSPGSERFAHEPLMTEGYAMAVPLGHALAEHGVLPGEAFRNAVMLVRRHCEALAETSRYFIERSVRPHFAARVTSDAKAIALIEAGLGITLMPESSGGSRVAHVRLEGFDLVRAIGLQFAPHAQGSAIQRSDAAHCIREAMAAIGQSLSR